MTKEAKLNSESSQDLISKVDPSAPDFKKLAEDLAEALEEANDKCRSAFQIAERKGIETNWEGFIFRLRISLNKQLEVLSAYRAAVGK